MWQNVGELCEENVGELCEENVTEAIKITK